MSFSAQEKLALMMSAEGMTQRRLGELLGVSHQRIGRYLREGDIGGVLAIPDDPAFAANLDDWFGEYVAVAQSQAKADDLPFSVSTPVYVERKPLSTGAPGDIVATGNTEYIQESLRDKWLMNVNRSRGYHKAMIRSVISLKDYFEGIAQDELDNGRRNVRKQDLQRMLMRNFIARERERGKIIDAETPFSMYTRGVDADTGMPRNFVNTLEDILRTKHQPATGKPGTKLAYEYVLQRKRPKRK